jgi:hypothetical protein
MAQKKSSSYEEACSMLPFELLPILDKIINHYKFASLKHHGSPMYLPKVLAELLLLGWRDVADPVNSQTEKLPQ